MAFVLHKTFQTAIIAHRGYKTKYPENTLLAFQKAIEVKADYIELDVHFTADKEIVVIHDYDTNHITSQKLVIRNTPLSILKKLDMGENQQIPLLQEVFDLCKGKIRINIEIKQKDMAKALIEQIMHNNMEDQVIISSFLHGEIRKVKEINSNICCATLEPTGFGKNLQLVIGRPINPRALIQHALQMQVQSINPYWRFVTPQFCHQVHQAGLWICPYTRDDPESWQKLIRAGVDAIFTNNPEGLYQYLQSYSH